MLTINKNKSGGTLTVALEGRVDISTAPDLEQGVLSSLDGVTELVFDLEKLVFISSAGLRVLLLAQKKMNKHGTMKVIHVNKTVMEVFVNMGFSNIMTIEQKQI